MSKETLTITLSEQQVQLLREIVHEEIIAVKSGNYLYKGQILRSLNAVMKKLYDKRMGASVL
jgi:hypothetical protein